ncbi:MAG: hypothetical protein JRM72_02470 [Nitrososphaerota archaeon]|nr:hypothetical protein [Nitrososphaerota archaeon]
MVRIYPKYAPPFPPDEPEAEMVRAYEAMEFRSFFSARNAEAFRRYAEKGVI